MHDDVLFNESNTNKNCKPLPVHVRNHMLRSLLEPDVLAGGKKHVQSALGYLVREETRKSDHSRSVMNVIVRDAGTPKASWETTGWNPVSTKNYILNLLDVDLSGAGPRRVSLQMR